MTFWDSSAVLPLLVWENQTDLRERQLREVDTMVVWWGTPVECHSALRRREREGALASDDVRRALKRLEALAESWMEVEPREAVRLRAERLLKARNLRAADALQLAAALVACGEQSMETAFHTADARLSLAAEAEGFAVK
jgi:hypothetical protein